MTTFILLGSLVLLVLIIVCIWLGFMRLVRLKRSASACEAYFRHFGLKCSIRDDSFLAFLAAAKFKGMAHEPTILESLTLRTQLLLAETQDEYIQANDALSHFYDEVLPMWCLLAPTTPSFTRAVASLRSAHDATLLALQAYRSQKDAFRALSERPLSRWLTRTRPAILIAGA